MWMTFILTRNNPKFLNVLIKELNQAFELKDLGDLHYFLGLQITKTAKGLFLNQTKYAHDLLVKHDILTFKLAKSLCTPLLRLCLMRGNSYQILILFEALWDLCFI